jgi:hypothetical protein
VDDVDRGAVSILSVGSEGRKYEVWDCGQTEHAGLSLGGDRKIRASILSH